MRMHLVAVLLPLVVVAPAAHAAPELAAQRGAEAVFALRAGSTTYAVTVLATQPVPDGAPQLRLEAVRADGTTTLATLYGELPAAALTDPAGSPVLRATVGGVRLVVTWHPATTPPVAAGQSRFSGVDADLVGWSINGYGGTADVQLGTARCRTDSVVVGPAVVSGGAAFGRPLREGLRTSLKGARCGPLPKSALLPT